MILINVGTAIYFSICCTIYTAAIYVCINPKLKILVFLSRQQVKSEMTFHHLEGGGLGSIHCDVLARCINFEYR